jgi:hypothetical protein
VERLITSDPCFVSLVRRRDFGAGPACKRVRRRGIKLEVALLPTAKRGFVLLPRRRVVERSFGWMSRFRRLFRDYERLLETLAGLHFLAFAILMLKNVAQVLA